MGSVRQNKWLPDWLRPAPDSMARHMCGAGFRSWKSLFYLAWLIWLFIPMMKGTADGPYYWSLGIGLGVFLVLVVLINVRPAREGRVYVWASVILACASMPFNPYAWTYGVFACAYVPWYAVAWHADRMIRQSIQQFSLIALVLIIASALLHWPWQQMLIMLGICMVCGASSLAGSISVRKTVAERVSREEVRRLAASAERERIGRDLHDLLGHTLSLITLKLELSRKLFDHEPERARRELSEAEEVARHALAEVRAAVTGIRATGLAGELASVKLLLRTSDVVLSVGDMPALPDAVDDTLAMVLREAATNIHRHARASHAEVAVRVADGHALMRVRDDGRGGVHGAGNGIKGMRERVRAMAGTLTVCSQPGEGTELDIDLPIPLLAAARADGSGSATRVHDNVAALPHRAGRSA